MSACTPVELPIQQQIDDTFQTIACYANMTHMEEQLKLEYITDQINKLNLLFALAKKS